MFFFLVDLSKRKVLRSSFFNIIDAFASKEEFDEFLDEHSEMRKARKQQDEDDGDEEGEEEEGGYLYDSLFECRIDRFSYLPSHRSVFLLVLINDCRLLIKIEDIFAKFSLKSKKVKFVKFVEKSTITEITNFGDDKQIVWHWGGLGEDRQMIKMGWLDPITLQEANIDFSEDKAIQSRKHAVLGLEWNKDAQFIKITENRILVLKPTLGLILDLKQKRVIKEHKYRFNQYINQLFTNINNLYVLGEIINFHLIKTAKKPQTGSEEVIDQIKTINLYDLIPGVNRMTGVGSYKFFRLNSGNYLYITALYIGYTIREDGAHVRPEHSSLVAVEIDPETLEVRAVWRKLQENFEGEIEVHHAQLINNEYLLLNGKLRSGDDQEGYQRDYQDRSTSLVLMRLSNFTILDHCSKAKLWRSSPIAAVSEDRVASIGDQNDLYLHEVDFEVQKLTLLKIVSLDYANIILNEFKVVGSSAFWFLVQKIDQNQLTIGERFLLKFDMSLDLKAHLKVSGARFSSPLFDLGPNEMVFVAHAQNAGCLFLLNLEDNRVKLAVKDKNYLYYYDYRVDGESGEVYSANINGENIFKVRLN